MANAPLESVTATRVRLLSAKTSRESCPLWSRSCLTLSRNTRRMSADRTGVLSRLLIIRPTNAAVGTRAESGCCAAAERAPAVSAAQVEMQAWRNRIDPVYNRGTRFATARSRSSARFARIRMTHLTTPARNHTFYPDSQWNVWMTTQNRLPVLKGTARPAGPPRAQLDADARIRDRLLARARGEQSLDLDDSALYQAVYRLEARGLLEADWGVTENNRRARYYKLTTAGRTFLRAETRNWMQYAETVSAILGAAKDGMPVDGSAMIRDGVRRAFQLALRRSDRWETRGRGRDQAAPHTTRRADDGSRRVAARRLRRGGPKVWFTR